ncbi:ABC transporter ATP-binding protein [Robertmurraya sp. DFI.2.37]|uniref:ABC transporter ATP-binding protein n=1 Tax=Robertmurraya sp. DFI.2.37 TaxID=3031819 RepID=UPI0012485E6B|nr:ABC transporter ATP-binding protein [Robertmurraya sp. DFI.2.37]MDF1509146.1 ABC transporter ATP-binding protein [Robertmurraya sp. DFI.2.37]
MNTILEAKELTKFTGDKESGQILKSVNLQVSEGEFVSIMGPSGSGKSTLLYNISGMDKATKGHVKLDGQEITLLPEKELSRLRLNEMGFIFQQIHLLKNLSIFDNIVLSAYLAENNSRELINKRAIELMEKTGILSLKDHDITQASGGQLQRVAICRALINQPKIVFADEPTGALNSKAAAEIMELLIEFNQTGTAILLVTHDLKVAAKTERVLYMLDGNLVGEKKLGKYQLNKNDLREREELLSRWLAKMDF